MKARRRESALPSPLSSRSARALATSAMGLVLLCSVLLWIRPPTSPSLNLQSVRIGHRGGCEQAPENTMTAIEMAASVGFEAVELDVRSSQGAFVLAHDAGDPETPLLPALELALALGLKVELDVKTPSIPSVEVLRELGQIIQQQNAQDQIWLSFFNPWSAWVFRREHPELATGFAVNHRAMLPVVWYRGEQSG